MGRIYTATRTQSSTGFGDPRDVQGNVLWLRGDLGMTQSGIITAWADQSGQGNNTTPTGSPTYTASAINGKPAATLVQGSSQYFALPNAFQALTSAEIFIVCTSTTTISGLHNFGNSAGAQQLYPFSDSHVYDNFASTTRNDCGIPTATLSQPNVYNARSASAAYSCFVNGTQLFTTGVNTVSWGANPAIGGSAGSGAVPTSFYSGVIAEVILYNSVLGSAARSKIHRYLRDRYAIAVLG